MLNDEVFPSGDPDHALLPVYVPAADEAPLSACLLHPREEGRLMRLQGERGGHAPEDSQAHMRAVLLRGRRRLVRGEELRG